MNELRILPPVFEDTVEATERYDSQLPGLGSRFIDSFYAAWPQMQDQPLIYRPVNREFRRILLKPFPYPSYFRIYGDIVIVVLVFHTVRKPNFMKKILQQR